MLRRAITALLLASALACRPERIAPAPDLTGVPPELHAAFTLLETRLSAADRDTLRATPRDELHRYHFGLGMGLRNDLGLWRDSAVRAPWVRLGLVHPDDISGVIIEAYWLRLNGRAIVLDSLVRAAPPAPVKFDTLPAARDR